MAKFKIKTNEKDWKLVKSRLKKTPKQVQVGWHGVLYPQENDYLPVAQVAKWNEEGHANGGMYAGTRTPPRPFLRTTFIYGMELYFNDHAKFFARNVAEGLQTWQEVAEKVGQAAKLMLQETIDVKASPPNGPLTVEHKGFNDPLIETGYMRDTISWIIKNKRRAKVADE